jgi:MFS family permease
MAVGVLLAGTGLAVSGCITSYPLLFVSVMISGIGIAAYHPEAARYANTVSGQKKGTGMSVFSFGGNLGFALGPIITMWLILSFGFKGMSVLFPASRDYGICIICGNEQIPTKRNHRLGRLENTKRYTGKRPMGSFLLAMYPIVQPIFHFLWHEHFLAPVLDKRVQTT